MVHGGERFCLEPDPTIYAAPAFFVLLVAAGAAVPARRAAAVGPMPAFARSLDALRPRVGAH